MTKDALLYAGNYITGKYTKKRIRVRFKKNGLPTLRSELKMEKEINEMLKDFGETSVWARYFAPCGAAELDFKWYMKRYREMESDDDNPFDCTVYKFEEQLRLTK